MIQPKILIVEDFDAHRYFYDEEIPKVAKWPGPLRLAPFKTDLAATPDEARRKITGRSAIYDLVLLDLDLVVPGDGFEILKLIQEQSAAREVIVVSGHVRPDKTGRSLAETRRRADNMLEAFQRGVADVIYKADLKEIERLQEAVVRSLMRTVCVRSKDALDRRIRDLVPHAEQGLVSHFGRCFARCISDVSRAGAAMRVELRERWGISSAHDGADTLVQQLDEIESSLSNGRDEWSSLGKSVGLCPGAAPEKIVIRTLFQTLETSLQACLTAKRTMIAPEGDFLGFEVLSFDGDVRAILTEMILGAVADLPDFGDREYTLAVSVEVQRDSIDLVLLDELDPILSEEARKINDGMALKPERFSRAWGLSVMQYAALRGGGRLTVTPREQGNETRYRIPLAINV
jgi:CheY-like chemotaxis protein